MCWKIFKDLLWDSEIEPAMSYSISNFAILDISKTVPSPPLSIPLKGMIII